MTLPLPAVAEGRADAAGQLRREHEQVRGLLDAITGIAERMEGGDAVPQRDVEAALLILFTYVDGCHHAKEERALFPTLAFVAPAQAARLVHRLEGDHLAARKLVGAMHANARAAAEGDPAARKAFAHAARLYTQVIDAHIVQEDEHLLPLLQTTLAPADRFLLLEAFETIEQRDLAPGGHERSEATIRALRDEYGHRVSQ